MQKETTTQYVFFILGHLQDAEILDSWMLKRALDVMILNAEKKSVSICFSKIEIYRIIMVNFIF